MRGELELGGIFAQLVKTVLIVGFFLFVLESPQYLKSIYQGFDKLGVTAGGNQASMDEITNQFINMWKKIYDSVSIWEPGAAIFYVIVGAIASVALLHLVGTALMFYAFTIFSIYVGIFFMAFGAFDQTRSWAFHAITNVVRWGVKWMMILLLMSITFTLVNDALSSATNNIDSMIVLLIVSILMVSINNGLSAFVDGYFSGMGGADNGRGMQMLAVAASAGAGAAVGAATGAAGGAMAASDAVKAAKAGNPDGGAGLKDYAKAAGGAMGSSFKGGVEGAKQGFLSALTQPPGFGKTSSGSSSSGMGGGSSGSKEVPLGTDSGFGGVDGTIGNATTEPKPNPNVVS
ncbi:MAG: type IV secretion system protein [Campylobacterales bacterium]|nr:type IV secretion system protein [Campylobacterales bacterium]